MSRYFLEVAYKGTEYSGFQSQKNANSIQAEVEKAFAILNKEKTILTGSSRTDAGVHALQNFFHFDYNGLIHPHFIYKINAILPGDIVVKALLPVSDNAHCRFDAISRQYYYHIYSQKDPFQRDRAFYFPYKLDYSKLLEAAAIVKEYDDFTSFSKRNTQAKTFICKVLESNWLKENNNLIYVVKANRFLRGMVRALTATMLLVGRDKLSVEEFRKIIQQKDCTKASFSVPANGLFLVSVEYPGQYY
ncbi:MAG TPA: tRNA pseudouridine(38-40) synthase TruA [Chitinophagaceae bacterium]|nr:tRNA pseudouridine(38-40) synthase TruA [Chitinophagaceae bacterium]